MNKLEELRSAISQIDAELIALIARRYQLSQQIGSYKHQHNLAVYDPSREAVLREFHAEECRKNELASHVVARIFEILIEESRKFQHHEQ